MNRKDELTTYLLNLYVPTKLKDSFESLLNLLKTYDPREINESDAHQMRLSCLVILTRGKGERESYQGYRISRIDFGDVGAKFADIAIFNDSDLAEPTRIDKRNIKINLPK